MKQLRIMLRLMILSFAIFCSSFHRCIALQSTSYPLCTHHTVQGYQMHRLSMSSTVPFKPPVVPPSKAPFSSLDLNRDGRLSMQEIINSPSTVLKHSPLIKAFLAQLRLVVTGKQSVSLWEEVRNLVHLKDVVLMSLLLVSYRHVFRFTYNFYHSLPLPKLIAQNRHTTPCYEKSILGYLEQPVGLMLWFPPFLYFVDLLSIVLAYLGFQFHIKGDIPRLLCTVAYSIIAGSFITKVKDWMVHKWRSKAHEKKLSQQTLTSHVTSRWSNTSPVRDPEKEKIIDELSSWFIWFIVAILCLQAFSLELGIGLGSLFALGGVGSASFVWAWRSTMENVVGGLLLKLQDKFRVGDKITVPSTSKETVNIGKDEGIVEEIGYMTTRLRMEDDSHLSVPNALFIQGQVINWSRTPYRLFTTVLKVSEAHIHFLPAIIAEVREVLQAEKGVESQQRDLIVSAIGFAEGDILIDVRARLKASNDQEIAHLRTRVIDKIAKAVNKICNTPDSTSAGQNI